MSRNVHRACRSAGLLGAWLCVALLAGAQVQPGTPPKKGTPATGQPNQPNPLYPGLEPNPFAFGQIPQPPAVPPVPPVPGGMPPAPPNPLRWFYNSMAPGSPYWNWMMGMPWDPNPGSVPYSGGQPGQNPYSPMPNAYVPKAPSGAPLGSGKYASHEALLEGLLYLSPRDLKNPPTDVVDVKAKMGDKELSTLVQSVNANKRLYNNAEQLTARLQDAGVLHPGDRVVGFFGGKVYAIISSR